MIIYIKNPKSDLIFLLGLWHFFLVSMINVLFFLPTCQFPMLKHSSPGLFLGVSYLFQLTFLSEVRDPFNPSAHY